MPRTSNGRPLSSAGNPSRSTKRKPPKNQSVNDALAIAEQQNPTKLRIRQHRLGDSDGDRNSRSTRLGGGGDLEDEDAARPSKRRKTQPTQGLSSDNDDNDSGSDSDGQHWHVGIDEDDEDSDLDSDDAMGESDEEKFQGFTFRGSAKQRRSKKSTQSRKSPGEEDGLSADLFEGEKDDVSNTASEADDSFGDEGVDLATALDLNGGKERTESTNSRRKEILSKGKDIPGDDSGSEQDGSDSEVFEESEDEESMFSYSENDDDEATNLSRLRAFIGDLEEQSAKKDQPRKQLPLSSLPEQPSDFGLKPSKKLQVADLLQTITDPRLRQSLKILHKEGTSGSKRHKGGIPGKLDPPLAKRQQDRLDREAAYEKSKETLNRWIDTVKHNRRAEHISFPLPDPDTLSALNTNRLMPTSQSAPLTSLESTIQNIMEESGLSSKNGQSADDRVLAQEELEEKKMPIEEVQARRAELRRARDLMFREEVRARRIKKIKSKAFRRVHRKERDKLAQEERVALAAAGVLDSDDDRERNDRRRAEERMGARHRESRWAKQVKATGKAAWDEDARLGVMDLAKKDEELRKRIQGKLVTESDQSAEDSSDSESENDRSSLHSEGGEARRLERKLQGVEAAPGMEERASKLSSMAFMQKAEARRKATNDAEIEYIRRNLAGDEHKTEDEEMARNSGRMKFGLEQKPTAQPQPQRAAGGEFEEPLSDDEGEMAGQQQSAGSEAGEIITSKPQIVNGKALNGVGKQATQRNAAAKNSQSAVPANPWLSESWKSVTHGRVDEPIISARPPAASEAMRLPREPVEQRVKAQDRQKFQPAQVVVDGLSDSDEEQPASAQGPPGQMQPRNKDLVRMAFAGDDVFEDFAKEKRETIDDEGDQIIDNSLPGWGSWTGDGISKRAQKRAKAPPTVVKGVRENDRKDARLDRVIINEKRNKKNSRYLASELPHPFESRQQYERSLRLPLGPEWTTKKTFQNATKPRVLVKQGIIRPMERPLA